MILSFKSSVSVLAAQANEGLLTVEERAAHDAYIINLDDFIAILKLKAQRYLATNGRRLMDAGKRGSWSALVPRDWVA